MLINYNGINPQIDPSAYVHSSAQVVGDVHLGPQSSAWFNVVVRGDVNQVRIGARTNIQDNSTVHVTAGRWPTIVGEDVTIAHGVILHGCTIGDRCLIGVGAIVLDGCAIGDDCMVGAASLVTPGTALESGQLMLGSPAKAVRPLDEAELQRLLRSARNYVDYAKRYRSQGIL